MPDSDSPEQVDRYIAQLFGRQHDNISFAEALNAMSAANMPSINVSASEGMILHVLARAVGAKSILEIGTLGGYSALWLASALPKDGRFVTLEVNETHARVARENLARAGFGELVDVRLGPALQSLAAMQGEEFDVTFIDADKPAYPEYLDHALRLTRVGGIILSDNTLGHGALEGDAQSPMTRFNEKLAATAGVVSAIIPTMREKIDGLTVSVVLKK